MNRRWTPYKAALVITWAAFAGWLGIAVYVLGPDGLIPSALPFLFALVMTRAIIRLERNTFHIPPADHHSGTDTEAQNLNRPPRQG